MAQGEMNRGTEVHVAPGLRSPFSRIDRDHSDRDEMELSVPVVRQTVAGPRGPGAGGAGRIDLVLWGAVIPSLRVSNWGRQVWLETGLDPHVPGQGLVQACGTSLAAATHAAGQVRSGRAALALAGGVESMTHAEIGLSQEASRTFRRVAEARSPLAAVRTLGEIRPSHLRLRIPSADERTTGMSMGEHCEEMAREWEIPREPQDRVALRSHRRAVRAREEGFFDDLLTEPGTYRTDRDTIPRPDTSLEALAGLPPAFDPEGGTLTAGNSTPLTDGAASVWIGSPRGLEALPDSLPRVRLLDWEQAAIDLRTEGLLMAPALALPRLLERHGSTYEEIELWEIHEAFAAQLLCTLEALESREWLEDRAGVEADLGDFPRDRLNPNGGSLAIGHPFAATGARILSQAVVELAEEPSGSRAVVSICAAGGLGHVALLESL